MREGGQNDPCGTGLGVGGITVNSCLAYYKEGYVQKYLQLYVYARVQTCTHISVFYWVTGPPRCNSSPNTTHTQISVPSTD